MRISHRVLLASAALAYATPAALAAPLVFEATGTIGMFSNFSGADRLPFLGASDNDPVFFHFEFDSDMTPSSVDGDWYRYTFDGSSSYIDLGPNRAYFETFVLSTGVTSSGYGGLTFLGENSTLGFSAGAFLFSSSPLSGEIPNSLQFDQFDNQVDFNADSFSNQLLLPIAFGPLDSATITPAPASALPLMCAGVLAGRRRRSPGRVWFIPGDPGLHLALRTHPAARSQSRATPSCLD